jgi:pantoate--beta-alanine ligase
LTEPIDGAKQVRIIEHIKEMWETVMDARKNGRSIGLVPTMGALHRGHLSLIERAAAENDVTIVSIFVNPIQFDDKQDLGAYPRDLARDAASAAAVGANAIFAPSVSEMYPDGFSAYVDMTGISEALCGRVREAHFRGVCTVVAKLFHITDPDRAYFGEKDAQQAAVIKKMAADLNFNTEIVTCPTVRDTDGLALSSRNTRLDAAERNAAPCLYRALNAGAALFRSGESDAGKITEAVRAVLEAEPRARVDYAEIVDPASFRGVPKARSGDVLALAVYIGAVRLIDNLRL